MKYELKFNSCMGIMAIPCEAVDKYINKATHIDLKVLLYLFRHSGEPLDPKKISSAIGTSEEELNKSLRFWSKAGFFTLLEPADDEKAKNHAKDEIDKARERIAASKVIDVPTQYGQEEIAKKSQENAEIKFLLETVPSLLGRLISPSECSTLVYLYEGAGLPADVIIMLVQYCVSSGKGNMRYIQKMAVSWAEEGIDNHIKAENKIKELEDRRSFEGQIRSIMGISDRALATAEKQAISRWCGWKTPPELVKLAYDICISRTGKLSFSYINSILNSWHEKGYTTVEQARNENKKGKSSSNGKSPSYDIDEYVRLSMKTLHDE